MFPSHDPYGKKAAGAVSDATKDGKHVSNPAKSKAIARKAGGGLGLNKGFTKALESHKAQGASFDSGKWKPAYKGQTFIEALESHKAERHKFR